MAKTIARLSAQQVLTGAFGPGLHSDGRNLYLRVGKNGSRSWCFVYRFGGRQRGRPRCGGPAWRDARGGAPQGQGRPDAARPAAAGRSSLDMARRS